MSVLAINAHQGAHQSPHQSARQSQQQNFSPRLQKAVKLLHLPTPEFNQAIEIALGQNPFLESAEPAETLAATDAENAELAPADDTAPWAGMQSGRGAHADLSALDLVASPTTLHEHLHSQLRLLRLSDRDFLLASVLVESLEEDGYLRVDVSEVGALAALAPPAKADELRAALHRVQSLEPAGVGARHLAECLQLQLATIEPQMDRALCAQILALPGRQLQALNISQLSHDLHRPLEQIHRALQHLRRLDPHPGWRHGDQPARYVTPDVLVRKTANGWQAVLNDAVVPRIQLNGSYAEVFRRHRKAENTELSAQLNEARWTLRHVSQRFSTILAVAQAILRRQHNFLEYGPVGMRPLGLREIADEVGVHESTVSRVTNNKYMAAPCGMFELKYFFSRGMQTCTGNACSPIAVRSLVREIIAGERPAAPLSDVSIASQLQRQGIKVARRTVTKYRQQLGIKPAEQRSDLFRVN